MAEGDDTRSGCGPILPGRRTDEGVRPYTGIAGERKSRFLHCAVAFAPAPVGMTSAFGWRRAEAPWVAGVEDGVVALAVAEGAGDAEAEAGGFEDEGEFGEFSAALGGELALARSLRGGF